MKASITARSAFELKNCHVMNAAGQTIGRLRDIVFYARQGVVSYAVIGLGGFCGIGERLISLPWTKLDIAPNGRFIRILGECPAVSDQLRKALPSAASQNRNGLNKKQRDKKSRSKQSNKSTLRLVRPTGDDKSPSEDGLFYRMFYASQEELKRPIESKSGLATQHDHRCVAHTAQSNTRR